MTAISTKRCEECGQLLEFREDAGGLTGKAIPTQRVRSVYAILPDGRVRRLFIGELLEKINALPLDQRGTLPGIDPEKIELCVNHFELCPNPGRFSGKA